MPSKTKAQARLMAAAAHDAAFAKRAGVPQEVARKFNRADARTGILKGRRQKPRTRTRAKRSYTVMI